MKRVLLLLSVLWVAACPKDDPSPDPVADGTKVTPDSTYSAKEPLLHEGLRFKLAVPGPKWKVLHAEDSQQFEPDSVAGAVSSEGWFATIRVERLPGLSLDEAEELLDDGLSGVVVEAHDTVEFAGLPARKKAYVVHVEGVPFRYARVTFLREGYLYTLLAWGNEGTTEASDLQPFFDAFSLTAGEIAGLAPPVRPVADTRGTTWQVTDGVFESALSGLRVSPPGGWHIIVGPELTAAAPNAEVMLAHPQSSAFISVTAERARAEDASAVATFIHTSAAETLGPGTPAEDAEIGGKRFSVTHYRRAGIALGIGALEHDGALLQVSSWYPKGLQEEASEHVTQALSSFSWMPSEERLVLADKLSQWRGAAELRRITSGARYFNGLFVDFDHELQWSAPDGLFDVEIGDRAREAAETAVLVAQAPLEGITMQLEVIPGGAADLKATHASVVAGYSDRKDSEKTLGRRTLSITTGTVLMGAPYTARAVSFAHGDDAVRISAWGPKSQDTALRLEELTGGVLPMGKPSRTAVYRGRFHNYHHGFSVMQPAGEPNDAPPPGRETTGLQFVRWTSPGKEFAVTSVPTPGISADEAWLTRFIEQHLREQVASRNISGQPASAPFNLEGAVGRRLDYGNAVLIAAAYGPALYLISIDGASASERSAFIKSFRWE